ncbi:hypothetical protein M0N98_03517 [Phocaeicola vulgatus]|nr:hypothetical protein M0N98_03517 [Phocaeicola vulgatus]
MIKNKIINYTIFAFSFFVWSNLHILHQPDSGQNCIFRGTKSSKVEKKRIFAYIEGGNLAASKIRNLECPSYEICLIDYGCGKFNRKIHIMEQYP